MINQIVKYLDVKLNGDIELIALENIVNAKMCQLVSSKYVNFIQLGGGKPSSLSYYAFNFLPSGIGKDLVVKLIDSNIMSFYATDLKKRIEEYKDTVFETEMLKVEGKDKKERKDIETRANELVNAIRCPNVNIEDSTFSGVYAEAKQIDRVNFGCICYVNNEYGDYLDNAARGDAQKKETVEKMKNVFDGTFSPRITLGDADRDVIYDVGIAGIFGSDYKGMTEEKTKKLFDKLMETGIARRSFMYMPKCFKPIAIDIDWRAKEKADAYVSDLENELKSIYDSIPERMTYKFSPDAKDVLASFGREMNIEFNNTYCTNSIWAKESKGALWKIQKLAIVRHAIKFPVNPIVDKWAVDEAINFYEKIKPCLNIIINTKSDSPEIKLKNYLTNKKNGDIITKTELRNEKFVNANMFAKWVDDAIDELQLDYLYPWKGKGRAEGWQIWK